MIAEPVRIALVGMGWWGRKMLDVLAAVPAEIRVVRAVEPNLQPVRELCGTRGIALSADYADVLNDPAVEAVVLATPHGLHEAQIAQAVAAGKHVFCEKPLALTKAGAERAVALRRDAGRVLGMGHERRWAPPVADLLAQADAGALGRIHQIEANFRHDKFLTLDRDNWRLKPDQAPAGGMTATGIHLLDLSVRLLGPAESVLCICEQLSSDLPQGDTVAAFAKFRGGGTSYVSASLANPFMSRLTVYGARGWIDIRDKADVEAPAGWCGASRESLAPEPARPSEPGKYEADGSAPPDLLHRRPHIGAATSAALAGRYRNGGRPLRHPGALDTLRFTSAAAGRRDPFHLSCDLLMPSLLWRLWACGQRAALSTSPQPTESIERMYTNRTPISTTCRNVPQREFRRRCRGSAPVGLRPSCALPRQRHTMNQMGRGSTYRKRNTVSTKPATSTRIGSDGARRCLVDSHTPAIIMVQRSAATVSADPVGLNSGPVAADD